MYPSRVYMDHKRFTLVQLYVLGVHGPQKVYPCAAVRIPSGQIQYTLDSHGTCTTITCTY